MKYACVSASTPHYDDDDGEGSRVSAVSLLVEMGLSGCWICVSMCGQCSTTKNHSHTDLFRFPRLVFLFLCVYGSRFAAEFLDFITHINRKCQHQQRQERKVTVVPECPTHLWHLCIAIVEQSPARTATQLASEATGTQSFHCDKHLWFRSSVNVSVASVPACWARASVFRSPSSASCAAQ